MYVIVKDYNTPKYEAYGVQVSWNNPTRMNVTWTNNLPNATRFHDINVIAAIIQSTVAKYPMLRGSVLAVSLSQLEKRKQRKQQKNQKTNTTDAYNRAMKGI